MVQEIFSGENDEVLDVVVTFVFSSVLLPAKEVETYFPVVPYHQYSPT